MTVFLGLTWIGATPVFEPIQATTGAPQRRESRLLQAADGNLYGVTIDGGAGNMGSIFKLTVTGELSTLVNLGFSGGWNIRSPLIQANDGNLYGTTGNGGDHNDGMVFRMTPSGVLTTLHQFNRSDGYFPRGTLIWGRDGNFYGTTDGGGSNDLGTIYKMAPDGTLTTLRNLNSASGFGPIAGLVQGPDGYFFGTNDGGGANRLGTVFRINNAGVFSVLFNFNSTNGSFPGAELARGTDGNFYGTTDGGGANGDGTAFRITPSGQLTTLVSFADGLGAKSTQVGLVQGPDGNFYSTTHKGGDQNKGTIYQMTPSGVLRTILSFDGANGSDPDAPLALGIDGNLYGTTTAGGTTSTGLPGGGGQIYRLRFGPKLATKAASRVVTTSACLAGEIDSSDVPSQISFQYGTNADPAALNTVETRIIPASGSASSCRYDVSGLLPGTLYFYRIVGSNADNPVPRSGAVMSFTTLPASTPSAEIWRIQHFDQSANTGDAAENADPDHDSVNNLLERAFNLDPLKPDADQYPAGSIDRGLPDVRVVGEGSDARLAISFIRRTSASNAGLIYTPQFCSDPGATESWADASGGETVTPINVDWEHVIVEDSTGGPFGKRFGRLKVSAVP